MNARLQAVAFDGSLGERLRAPVSAGLSLYWLGQAGFVIDVDNTRIVIDPYLSDSLHEKYRDKGYSHARMAPAPVTPDELGHVDFVLTTHHHTDHMDALTLQALAHRLPDCKFFVPRANLSIAASRTGAGDGRLIGMDAGEVVKPASGVRISAFRAAHETLETNEAGEHLFLGFGIEAGRRRIFHSGDSIPFDGQVEEVSGYAPHLTLLPVNGRKAELSNAGIAGNFSIDEAIDLAIKSKADAMIAHHFGMFAFNTADPEQIDTAAEGASIPIFRAAFGVEFRLAVL